MTTPRNLKSDSAVDRPNTATAAVQTEPPSVSPYTKILDEINNQWKSIWKEQKRFEIYQSSYISMMSFAKEMNDVAYYAKEVSELEQKATDSRIRMEKMYQALNESLLKPKSNESSVSCSKTAADSNLFFSKTSASVKDHKSVTKQPTRLFWPREALWKLLVDEGDRLSEDPYIYDNDRMVLHCATDNTEILVTREGEKGYLNSMQLAFSFVEKTVNEPLTVDYLEVLHDAAVQSTKLLKGIRTDSKQIHFHVIYSTGTLEGIKELQKFNNMIDVFIVPLGVSVFNEEKCIDMDVICNKLKAKTWTIRIIPKIHDVDDLKLHLSEYLECYNVEIKKASNDRAKILAIVKLVRALELMHPFYDGNARTFGFLLCNKLLMQQGFGPAIMNPNKFDGHSCNELVDLIVKGIALAEEERVKAVKKLNPDLQSIINPSVATHGSSVPPAAKQ